MSHLIDSDDLEQACRRLAISRDELMLRVHEAGLERQDRELSAEIKRLIEKADASPGRAMKYLLQCQDLEARRAAIQRERFGP